MGLISLRRIENASPHSTWNDSLPPKGDELEGLPSDEGH